MTSLLAWMAYDSRRATALYIASDSRANYDNGTYSDNCTKVYVAVARTNQSEIFGFCGDIDFAHQALEAICQAITNLEIPTKIAVRAESRAEWIHAFLNQQLLRFDRSLMWPTTILHGSRESWGGGATFSLSRYHGEKNSRSLDKRPAPLTRAEVYVKGGTGGEYVLDEVIETRAATGDYSRAYFGGFCQSLRNEQSDKFSGGPVQLVGISQVGDARYYGVVQEDGAFFRGEKVMHDLLGVRWFDVQMQLVDRHGKLLKNAQPHGWRKHKKNHFLK